MSKADVLNVLSRHVGRDKGINISALALAARVEERMARKLVSDLREDGIAVCAHPKTGYFIAETDAELDRYCIQFLQHRAMHSLRMISRLKKIALPDLLGQLHLKT